MALPDGSNFTSNTNLTEPSSQRVRAGIAVAILASGMFFTPETPQTARETVTVDRWNQQWREPVRVNTLHAAFKDATQTDVIGPIAAVPKVDIEWLQPLAEPVRTRALPVAEQLAFVEVEKDAFLVQQYEDRWHQAFAEVTRMRGFSVVQQVAATFGKATPFLESITSDRWEQPWSQPVRTRTFLTAQQQTDVFFNDPPFPEFTTAAEWGQPWSLPVRQAKTHPAFAPELSFNGFAAFSDVPAKLDEAWTQPWREPVRVRPFPVAELPFWSGDFYQPIIDTDEPDHEGVPWFEPVRRTGINTALTVPASQFIAPTVGTNRFIEVPFAEKFALPWSEPIRLTTRVQLPTQEQQTDVFFNDPPFPETTSVDKYYQQWREPLRVRPVVQIDAPQVFQAAFLEVPKNDTEWLQPLSEPVRRISSHALQPPMPFVFGELPSTQYRWFQPLSEPVRVRALPISEHLSFVTDFYQPIIDTDEPDHFEQRWSEPVRVRTLSVAVQSTIAQAGVAAITDVPRNDMEWFAPFAEPVRRAVLPVSEDQFDFVLEEQGVDDAAQHRLDAWAQPWTPPYLTRALHASQRQPFTVAERYPVSQTPDFWAQPWSEPVRVRAFPVAEQAAAFFNKASLFVESITSDRWAQPWSEPVRVNRIPTAEQQAFIYDEAEPFPEDVGPESWEQPWSLPVRANTRSPILPVAEQSSAVTSQRWPVEPTIDRWQQPLAAPITPRVNALTAACAQQASQPIPTNLPGSWKETVTADRWQQPWSEPVRVNRIPTAEQQAFIYDEAEPFVGVISVDGFGAPFSEPVRVRTLHVSQQQPTTTSVIGPILEVPLRDDEWLAPWAVPVKLTKAALPTHEVPAAFFVGAARFPETVTADRWQQPWSQPVTLAKARVAYFPPQESWIRPQGFYGSLAVTDNPDTFNIQGHQWIALGTFTGIMRVPAEVRTITMRPRDDQGALQVKAENRRMTLPSRNVIS